MGCHGRTASYLTAPAQIPACGITALGSSEILASVKDKTQQGLSPVKNIELIGALPLKVSELLSWYTFPIYLI